MFTTTALVEGGPGWTGRTVSRVGTQAVISRELLSGRWEQTSLGGSIKYLGEQNEFGVGVLVIYCACDQQ